MVGEALDRSSAGSDFPGGGRNRQRAFDKTMNWRISEMEDLARMSRNYRQSQFSMCDFEVFTVYFQ